MLTIIIPAYNREGLLPRTLASVKAQTLRPLSVILVDNCSTDATMRVMEDWAKENNSDDFRVSVLTAATPGAAAARNAGLAACTTEWTMFFDSDDEMAPEHAEKAMKCVDEHPKAEIVGWDVEIETNGKKTKKEFARFDLLFHCVTRGLMATQRYMARTELFRRAGGWRDDVKVWNDIELGVRLLALQPEPLIFKLTGAPQVVVHTSADSLSGPSFSSRAAEREHALDCIEQTLPEKEKWLASLQRAILAGNYYREGEKERAQALMSKVKCDSKWHDMLCHAAYRLTKAGIRGAARLMRMLD